MHRAAWRDALADRLEMLDLRLGRTGWTGLALTCVAALVAAVALPPLLEQARDADTRWRELEASAVTASTATPDTAAPLPTMPPLPAKSELPAIAALLMHEAAQAGLGVRGAEYRLGSAASGPYQDIAFDAEGSYVAARSFINAVVAQQPGLALRGLSLKKEGAQTNENALLKLHFEWRVFLKEAS